MKSFKVIDLTHTMGEHIPTWDGNNDFKMKITYYGDFCAMKYEMFAGFGTHIDSPLHVFKNGKDVSQIDVKNLVATGCIVNITKQVDKNFDYMLSVEDLLNFEKKNGKIPAKSIVIAYTGWSTRWHDIRLYRNVQSDESMHFPSYSSEAADFLIERDVVGIGIDTLSPDAQWSDFSVHRKILGSGRYILENLNNLNLLPEFGSTIVALPLKIQGGAESPLRVIGLI